MFDIFKSLQQDDPQQQSQQRRRWALFSDSPPPPSQTPHSFSNTSRHQSDPQLNNNDVDGNTNSGGDGDDDGMLWDESDMVIVEQADWATPRRSIRQKQSQPAFVIPNQLVFLPNDVDPTATPKTPTPPTAIASNHQESESCKKQLNFSATMLATTTTPAAATAATSQESPSALSSGNKAEDNSRIDTQWLVTSTSINLTNQTNPQLSATSTIPSSTTTTPTTTTTPSTTTIPSSTTFSSLPRRLRPENLEETTNVSDCVEDKNVSGDLDDSEPNSTTETNHLDGEVDVSLPELMAKEVVVENHLPSDMFETIRVIITMYTKTTSSSSASSSTSASTRKTRASTTTATSAFHHQQEHFLQQQTNNNNNNNNSDSTFLRRANSMDHDLRHLTMPKIDKLSSSSSSSSSTTTTTSATSSPSSPPPTTTTTTAATTSRRQVLEYQIMHKGWISLESGSIAMDDIITEDKASIMLVPNSFLVFSTTTLLEFLASSSLVGPNTEL